MAAAAMVLEVRTTATAVAKVVAEVEGTLNGPCGAIGDRTIRRWLEDYVNILQSVNNALHQTTVV